MRKVKVFASSLVLLLVMALSSQLVFAAMLQAKPNQSISSYDESRPQFLSAGNLHAETAILVDADTGRVLFEKKSDKRMYPASVTKVLTTLLALENLNPNDMVTVSKKAAAIGESAIYCMEGEEISVKDLLYGTMLRSSNSMSAALGEAAAGSIPDFVAMMNQRAKDLGCEDTNFVTTHGLTEENHYSTAADMAKIVTAAVQNEDFRKIIRTVNYEIDATNMMDKTRKLVNSNVMLPDSGNLQFSYQYMRGGKTGYTDRAQHTFFGYAEKDGVRLVAVVFGTTQEGKWLDTKKLMEYGFANYSSVSVPQMYQESNPFTTNVSGCASGDDGILQLGIDEQSLDASGLSMLVSNNEKDDIIANFQSYCTIKTNGSLVAPVQQGQQVATLTFQYGTMEPIEVPMVALRTVAIENVSIAPPPSSEPAGVSDSGLFVSSGAVENGFSPLLLLVIVPAVLFVVLMIWLIVEVKKYSKVKRKRKMKEREDAIRKRYADERKRRDHEVFENIRLADEESRKRMRSAMPQHREDYDSQTLRREPRQRPYGPGGEVRGVQMRPLDQPTGAGGPNRRQPLDTRRPRRI